MAKSKTRGGKKLDAFLRNAKTAQGVESVEIGFFSGDKYPDGTPVITVAAVQEFGSGDRIPERPAFRQGVPRIKTTALAVLIADVDPKTMVVTRRTAERVGQAGQGVLRDSYQRLKNPENAPSTIERKGSANPLIDEDTLIDSVDYRVKG